ncbi:hypothetical protein V5O48_012025 [Marasmius crinis-equi]|uniref:UDP-Glycosyltransferase/glycogen phosphorylase n=1 Tax=Marasmius crinis-equi TaxID=585013 RepID=A0ABR3F3X1_9AGAR
MTSKHILLHTVPGWGHVKPLVALMVFIAEMREDVVLTLPVGLIASRAVEELAKLSKERHDKIRERIYVIDLPTASLEETLNFEINEGFDRTFTNLYNSGSFNCVLSGKAVTGLPRPSLAVIDPFAGYAIKSVRSLATPQEIPILSWVPTTLGWTTRELGPETLSGLGDFESKINNEVSKSGTSVFEAALKLYTDARGEVIRLPGYPPVYDYELVPQDFDYTPAAMVARMAGKHLHRTEGLISVSTSLVEKEAIRAFREYFKGLGKDHYLAGFVSSANIPDPCGFNGDEEVKTFLDRIHQEHGEKSLLYISFGTFFWPRDPSKVYAAVEELIQARTPFLFAHASPLGSIPDDLKTKIHASGIGKEVGWAPQNAVLQHPATGWFITHGGLNSFQEAFTYKVPLIFWPMGVDQPLSAAILTLEHKASFELIAVRTGKGIAQPHRFSGDSREKVQFTLDGVRAEVRQLLIKIKGEEGKAVRANAERLSEQISQLWKEGGEARVEMEHFLRKYLDSL